MFPSHDRKRKDWAHPDGDYEEHPTRKISLLRAERIDDFLERIENTYPSFIDEIYTSYVEASDIVYDYNNLVVCCLHIAKLAEVEVRKDYLKNFGRVNESRGSDRLSRKPEANEAYRIYEKYRCHS